jgi:hypothetical protein
MALERRLVAKFDKRGEERPHYKAGVSHKKGCQCFACKSWRKGKRSDAILKAIEEAERRHNDG